MVRHKRRVVAIRTRWVACTSTPRALSAEVFASKARNGCQAFLAVYLQHGLEAVKFNNFTKGPTPFVLSVVVRDRNLEGSALDGQRHLALR